MSLESSRGVKTRDGLRMKLAQMPVNTQGTVAIWTRIGELILLQGDYLLNSSFIGP